MTNVFFPEMEDVADDVLASAAKLLTHDAARAVLFMDLSAETLNYTVRDLLSIYGHSYDVQQYAVRVNRVLRAYRNQRFICWMSQYGYRCPPLDWCLYNN